MNGLGNKFDEFLKDYKEPPKGTSNRDLLRQQDVYIKFTAYRVGELEDKLQDYPFIRMTVKNIVRMFWITLTASVGTLLVVMRGPIGHAFKKIAEILGGN